MKTILLALPVSLFSLSGFAADVSKHTCKQPKLLTRAADMDETKRFDRDFAAYKTCITKYISEHGDLAQAHQKAAKDAVAEINGFVAKANAK